MALQLLAAPPVLPPRTTLALPQNPFRIHPQAPKLMLTDILLSSDPSKTEAFHRKLPSFCFSHGEQAQNYSMGRISKDGCCVGKEVDPFQPPIGFLLDFLLE